MENQQNSHQEAPEVKLKTLPLKSWHEKAAARFGNFAGWQMPLYYEMGVLQEHLHCRSQAGLFDISHMQLICLKGRDSAKFLSYALPLAAETMAYGQCRYNFILNEDAGILDDIIVTRLSEQEFLIAANAANAEQDLAILRARAAGFACDISVLPYVFLALQGPKSAQILTSIGWNIADLSFMQMKQRPDGSLISRSGYSGEDGFEIALPIAQAPGFLDSLLAQRDVAWIGLAARDSLRLEAGLCLHGQDITKDTNPVEASLLWAVAPQLRENGRFIGAAALERAIKGPISRKRVGFIAQNKQPIRKGAVILADNDREIGVVTSGGFGPSLQAAIGMAYVEREFAALNSELLALVRGRKLPITICKMPFIAHKYVKA